jgi:hypothetical protein
MAIGDFSISKNGTAAAMASAATATHLTNGYYFLNLSTGNTDTLGEVAIICNKATYTMAVFRFNVVPGTVYAAIRTNAVNVNGGFLAATATTTVNANVGTTQPINFTGTAGSALAKSDAVDFAGTAQTPRDIGASVLLSSGTGTGQLDFTSGVVKANFVQILATALTETAGFLAAGFKKFFNVAVPVATVATVDQTGDSYGIVSSGTFGNAAIKGYVDDIGVAGAGLTALGDTRLANLDAAVSSRMATYTQPTGFLAANFTTSFGHLDVDVSSRMATYTQPTGFLATAFPAGTVASSTEALAVKAKTDNLPADPADASDIAASFSTVNATLATIAGYVDTEVAAIKAKTDNLPASPAAVGSAMTLTGDYDPAKTAAQAGDAMALTSGERSTLSAALLDLANGVETGVTLRQFARAVMAAVAGKSDGLATATAHYRDQADSKNRITATCDADGNRSAVTLDVT